MESAFHSVSCMPAAAPAMADCCTCCSVSLCATSTVCGLLMARPWLAFSLFTACLRHVCDTPMLTVRPQEPCSLEATSIAHHLHLPAPGTVQPQRAAPCMQQPPSPLHVPSSPRSARARSRSCSACRLPAAGRRSNPSPPSTTPATLDVAAQPFAMQQQPPPRHTDACNPGVQAIPWHQCTPDVSAHGQLHMLLNVFAADARLRASPGPPRPKAAAIPHCSVSRYRCERSDRIRNSPILRAAAGSHGCP